MTDKEIIEEQEANEFAMELLMPSEWLLKACKGIELFDKKALKKIADKYKVDPELIVYRMGQISSRRKP